MMVSLYFTWLTLLSLSIRNVPRAARYIVKSCLSSTHRDCEKRQTLIRCGSDTHRYPQLDGLDVLKREEYDGG